jgi:DNA-binding transcriptional ArsR family regulator
MYSRNFEKRLRFLLEGSKGGGNRIKILDLIRKKPYNLNQLSTKLKLNYRTIRHHVDVLLKEELVFAESNGRYGSVFFPSAFLESNIDVYNSVVGRRNRDEYIEEYVDGKDFYQNVLNHLNLGVLIVDSDGNPIYINGYASGLFGISPIDALGSKKGVISDSLLKNHSNIVKKGFGTNGGTHGRYNLGVGKKKKTIVYSISRILDKDGGLIGYSYILRHDADEPAGSIGINALIGEAMAPS